jgi:hypothetical protein
LADQFVVLSGQSSAFYRQATQFVDELLLFVISIRHFPALNLGYSAVKQRTTKKASVGAWQRGNCHAGQRIYDILRTPPRTCFGAEWWP